MVKKKIIMWFFFVHTSCMVLDLLIVMFYKLDIFACLTICKFFKNNCIIIFLFFFFFTDAVGINTGTKRLTFYSEQLWAMCNILWMSLYSSADFLLELPCQCCNYMYKYLILMPSRFSAFLFYSRRCPLWVYI